MVFNTIDKLREKPEHHRRRVAMGVSGMVTLFIFAVWFSVHMPGGSNAQIAATSQPVVERASENTNSPLDTLREGVAQIYEAIKNLTGGGEEGSFSEEYERIKTQIEEGELEFVPGEEGMNR